MKPWLSFYCNISAFHRHFVLYDISDIFKVKNIETVKQCLMMTAIWVEKDVGALKKVDSGMIYKNKE